LQTALVAPQSNPEFPKEQCPPHHEMCLPHYGQGGRVKW
jgi:hypothetical protein